MEEEISLNKGWNLIGSSFNCTIQDPDSIIEPNTLYEFNNGFSNAYSNVSILEENEGYYVFANSSGIIKLIRN